MKTRSSLRTRMDSDLVEWSDLSVLAKGLLSDYFSHVYTTETEEKESNSFLEEMEIEMDLWFSQMAMLGFSEKVQRLIWDFCDSPDL